MLEEDGKLRTWQLDQLPTGWAEALGTPPGDQATVNALPLPDHRLIYLEYEGPLSDNRGTVSQCDAGNFQTTRREEQLWEFELAGSKITGCARLTCKKQEWLLEDRC